MTATRTIYESAARIAERITEELARDFRSSQPRPRAHAMGFARDAREPKQFNPFKTATTSRQGTAAPAP